MPAVLLFAVFAAVDLFLLICEDEDVIQTLFDGSDAPRVFAADHIFDFFWESELLFGYDLLIFNNIHRNVMIDESEDVKIHEINRAFDLHNIFFSHFIAFCIFDNRDTAVQLVKM